MFSFRLPGLYLIKGNVSVACINLNTISRGNKNLSLGFRIQSNFDKPILLYST